MRSKLRPPLAATALLLLTAAPAAAQADRATAAARAAAGITAEQVGARIDALAHDSMRGRDTPSPELERTAEHLARQLAGFGLRPAGDAGSFIQRYPFVETAFEREKSLVAFEGLDAAAAYAYGKDYFFFPSQGDAAAAEALFVGPASRAANGLPAEAKGRIVVVTTAIQPGMELLQIPRMASEAGAVGVLFVMHPMHAEPVMQMITGQMEGLSLQMPLPTAGLRFDHAKRAFAGTGADTLILTDSAAAPRVLPKARVRLVSGAKRTEHMVPNVVGLLPGSDPRLKDEYVVVSAHFDHVGVGTAVNGDSIYNGADDNASGTAAVLEVAEALVALPQAPARSTIFLLVSGEEKGLLGALHYGANPTVPIDRIIANINLDMVGRNSPDTVIAIGQEYTTLAETARRASADHAIGLNVVPDPNPAEMAFFRSDHVAFVKRDIPSIFFTGWLHADYHQPSDHPDRIVDEKAARIARLVFWMLEDIGNAQQRPAWLPGGLEKVREVLKASPF